MVTLKVQLFICSHVSEESYTCSLKRMKSDWLKSFPSNKAKGHVCGESFDCFTRNGTSNRLTHVHYSRLKTIE